MQTPVPLGQKLIAQKVLTLCLIAPSSEEYYENTSGVYKATIIEVVNPEEHDYRNIMFKDINCKSGILHYHRTTRKRSSSMTNHSMKLTGSLTTKEFT